MEKDFLFCKREKIQTIIFCFGSCFVPVSNMGKQQLRFLKLYA